MELLAGLAPPALSPPARHLAHGGSVELAVLGSEGGDAFIPLLALHLARAGGFLLLLDALLLRQVLLCKCQGLRVSVRFAQAPVQGGLLHSLLRRAAAIL